jgi:hypothetical protein
MEVRKCEIGNIYESVNWGSFEVIEKNSTDNVVVRFVETGFVAKTTSSEVGRGNIKDWSNTMSRSIGKLFPTLQCGDVEILEYIDGFNVKVRFLNTGYEGVYPAGNIKKGKIMDWTAPLVYGIGCMGFGKHTSANNKPAYRNWVQMIERCYVEDEKFINYFDKCVIPAWHNFQNFADWSGSQTGFNVKGWQLDKDILIPDNKEYGPDVCCYVPARINSLIIRSNPEGMAPTSKWNKWVFTYREADGHKIRKAFDTQDLGKRWYKLNKERVVKEVADQYKNELDSRVYEALYLWQVN